jgi:hypothetical protein
LTKKLRIHRIHWRLSNNNTNKSEPQALVSFKKYIPPPLPYFKVNICPFPLPHFASIFFAYLWSFRWPNYIVTLPRYFSFRLPPLHLRGDVHDGIVTHGQSREFGMHMKNPAQTGSSCIRFNDWKVDEATFAEYSCPIRLRGVYLNVAVEKRNISGV